MRKQIKWFEIESVLQSYYDRKANGEIKYANILFYEKGDGDYSNKIVEKWFRENMIEVVTEFGQNILYNEDSQHILHKTNNHVISDKAIDRMNKESAVLLMENYNSLSKDGLAISRGIIKNRRAVDIMHNIDVDSLFITVGFCHYNLLVEESFDLEEYEPYTDIYEIEFDKSFVEKQFNDVLYDVKNPTNSNSEKEALIIIKSITAVLDVIGKVDLTFCYTEGENWFSPMSAINLFHCLIQEVDALYEDNIDLAHNTAVKKGFSIIMDDYRKGATIGGVSLSMIQKIYQEYFGENI